MVAENFQIYSVKITSKYICAPKNYVQKKNLFIFNHAPKQNSPPGKKEIAHSSRTAFSKNIFSWAERGGRVLRRIMELKKIPKFTRALVKVLKNPTIFATFTFLVYVLLCNNLASSMLKCEGSLT